MDTGEALRQVFESEDHNGVLVNAVDAVKGLSDNARAIADKISPVGAAYGTDDTGGTVASLTEAVMGVTAGLCKIADAVDNLAEATRERQGGE